MTQEGILSTAEKINQTLASFSFSKVFILCDSNTLANCVEPLLQHVEMFQGAEILEIPAGEESKCIEVSVQLWNTLAEYKADRKSVVINVGGGVVTDLGGFVASTYKRGIAYINIPTTLLSIVDAANGGKTGIDLGHLKNMVGTFCMPEKVIVCPYLLSTLPPRQLANGYAECVKHALIENEELWQTTVNISDLSWQTLASHIDAWVAVKDGVVSRDPKEFGERKLLNLGHTIAHAVEAEYLKNGDSEKLYHGEAVMYGLVAEAFLAQTKLGLAIEVIDGLVDLCKKHYSLHSEIRQVNADVLIHHMKYDKKNSGDQILFALPQKVGEGKWDIEASTEEISLALEKANQALFA